MRLLLDAHVSGRVVGQTLRVDGDFSAMIAGLRTVLAGTDAQEWSNRTVWLRR